MLRDRKPGVFAVDGVIQDWIILLETLLQWEMWLKSDEMVIGHVRRSDKKHRYIMHLIRKVANRVEGMGLKIPKYHMIMHMFQDILDLGVPMEYDTGSNERGHKPTKTAAKLTQRSQQTFDKQTCRRLREALLLDLAMEEIRGKPLWKYGCHTEDMLQPPPNHEEPYLGGPSYVPYFDPSYKYNRFLCTSRSTPDGDTCFERQLVNFVHGLQEVVRSWIPQLAMRPNHHRYGRIFRATTNFKGAMWRDWAMIDWGEEGILPCKLWGFVDLRRIPEVSTLKYGGTDLQKSMYAIVEYAVFVKPNRHENTSEIFRPIQLKEGSRARFGIGRYKFYLATVDAFVRPVTVVPDIGNQADRYFVVRERAKWAEDFESWLESPHNQDIIEEPIAPNGGEDIADYVETESDSGVDSET